MIFGALLLILFNARDNISYFYTPSELIETNINFNKQIRIGGYVQENTFVKLSASSFKFRITDNINSIEILYNGILPDLFREGQGAVVEGYMNNENILTATIIFAKHDENYLPASIKEDLENKGYWNKDY